MSDKPQSDRANLGAAAQFALVLVLPRSGLVRRRRDRRKSRCPEPCLSGNPAVSYGGRGSYLRATAETARFAPGERWHGVLNCNNPGTWVFHCLILPRAESDHGVFGMVTALIAQQ